MVSNMSIMQKVITRVMAVNQPICKKPSKSNLKRVVSTMSAKGGTKEAVDRDAKGFTPSTAKSPTQ